jgi:hypothetical protein
MADERAQFTIRFDDPTVPERTVETDGILIGRLETADLVLDHKTVSRVHAGINLSAGRFSVANLSTSNPLSLNGRHIRSKQSDVLANGDVIQIGPFVISIIISGKSIGLKVERQAIEAVPIGTVGVPTTGGERQTSAHEMDGVLKVFWEKRSREKEDEGSRLRPTDEPIPGKAMFNWRPTRDLQRPWRAGVFVWGVLVVCAVAAFGYLYHPVTFAPAPLASPHAMNISESGIAARANANSCTTCHAPDEPMENACIRCHTAAEFHPSNTKAHEEAGITCTMCHKEHLGPAFDSTAAAIASCAECHNDSNPKTYNGRAVRTAHGGGYGYPADEGKWTWRGVHNEVADAIPEINSSATGDANEQAKISRHFHTVHVSRLKAPAGLAADARGLVSCSTCHKSFDPLDVETARATCGACHTNSEVGQGRDTRFAAGQPNCISCHVQHPYSTRRWSEFLTDEALNRRRIAIAAKIAQVSSK